MHEDPLSEEQALATLVFEPPPAPLTQLSNVKTFTGFDIHILQHFATLTKCCLDDVVLTLTVLHHNPEWGLLSAITPCLLGHKMSTTSCIDRVARVLECVGGVDRAFLKAERFSLVDTRLPDNITAIVDGFPIYTRGKDELYNGKKRRKYYSIQVYTTLNQDPLTFTGPVMGRTHDSRAAEEGGEPFDEHYADELWLGDSAYICNAHVLAPFKKPHGRELDNDEKLFNKVHSHRRAREERFFAYLIRHAFARENNHRKEFIEKGMHCIWIAECISWQSKGTRLRYPTLKARENPIQQLACNCGLRKANRNNIFISTLRFLTTQDLVADADSVKLEITPKRPRNRAIGT